jgi:hypothetical protein
LLIALDPLQAPQHDVKLAGDLDCSLGGDGERELVTGEEDLDSNVGVAGAERAFGSLGHSSFSHFLVLGTLFCKKKHFPAGRSVQQQHRLPNKNNNNAFASASKSFRSWSKGDMSFY